MSEKIKKGFFVFVVLLVCFLAEGSAKKRELSGSWSDSKCDYSSAVDFILNRNREVEYGLKEKERRLKKKMVKVNEKQKKEKKEEQINVGGDEKGVLKKKKKIKIFGCCGAGASVDMVEQ